MSSVWFYSEHPATSIRSFESPLSEYRQSQNRPALRPQFGSFAAGLCTREGDFWSDRRLGPLARTRGGCISPVDQLPAAVHDPAVNKSENPKPQGDEWPASNTAIPPSTTSAPANCWAKTAMP